MRMKRKALAFSIFLPLLLGILLLIGCRPELARSERVTDDWSRGQRLGEAIINDRVGFVADRSGQNIYAIWVARRASDSAQELRFVHVDRAGRILGERALEIAVNKPGQVEIVLDGDDHLHLAWVDDVGEGRRLFYAMLDSTGGLLSERKPLSLPQAEVDSYAMGLGPSGNVDLFWSARGEKEAGLYHTRVGANGERLAENVLLQGSGFDPTFRIDRQGLFHLAWYEEPDYGRYALLYATFDAENRQLGPVTKLVEFSASAGVIGHHPRMGLAGDDVYLFWSSERRGGGIKEPAAQSFYLTFPLGRPELAGEQKEVQIPDLNHPRYQETKGSFNLHEMASDIQDHWPSEIVYFAATPKGHHDELPVAFSVRISGRTKQINQIILTVWSDGELKGYQIAAKTSTSSLRPVLLVDAEKDLHMVWIDTGGFGIYDLFYASTSQEARGYLNRLTGQDILAKGFNTIWGMVQAAGFVFVALIWVFPPLVLLAAYALARADDDLSHRGPRIVLILAIILYSMFKYLFEPGWLAALRLPHQWPADVVTVIMITLPFLISLLAGVVAWAFSRRRDYNSLFGVFGIFVGTDALLTLMIYVPGLLAE